MPRIPVSIIEETTVVCNNSRYHFHCESAILSSKDVNHMKQKKPQNRPSAPRILTSQTGPALAAKIRRVSAQIMKQNDALYKALGHK